MSNCIILPNGQERTLDYVPKLYEANNNYLIRNQAIAQKVAASKNLMNTSQFWTPGMGLNQQAEGACVPHGIVHEALSSPVRVRMTRDHAQRLALVDGYNWCRRNDYWPGEDYEGTSVHAGMDWGRLMQWWKSYYWAKNMDELRLALEFGPVVIGVEWRQGMYATDERGRVRVTGDVVGGHCLLLNGYTPRWTDGTPRFRWFNSWGPTYGRNGHGYILPSDLNAILFGARNEAAVATQRMFGLAV